MAFRGLVKAVVTCYILFSSDIMSFYGKKKFREVSSSLFVSLFSQSVPCFSHVLSYGHFKPSCVNPKAVGLNMVG